MTEEEAKTKTCHQTFAVPVVESVREYGPWNCIGSQCMAWRKDLAAGIISDGGYCGLAGKP